MRFAAYGLRVARMFDAPAEGFNPQYAAQMAQQGDDQPKQGLRGFWIVIRPPGISNRSVNRAKCESKASHEARGRQCLSRQRFAAPRPLRLHDECDQRSDVFAWRILASCRSCVCPPYMSAPSEASCLAASARAGMAASLPQACHQD